MDTLSSFIHLNRRHALAAVGALALAGLAGPAWSSEEAPEAFIGRITNDTLNTIKADKALRSGDIQKLMQLVDNQLMPHVNFRRMTALATGPAWRSATPEQQKRLQDEFKILLVRTYSGALMIKTWWSTPRSVARVTPYNSITAWKKHPVRARVG
jgi:phospholipid transport system substrate-binding protein